MLTKLGNHFMVYISEIIMLYTLNLHCSAVCQLYLNRTAVGLGGEILKKIKIKLSTTQEYITKEMGAIREKEDTSIGKEG